MILESSGGPIQRFVLERWLRNKDAAYLARMVRKFRPKEVVEQQQKIAHAQGLAIIFPVWFGCHNFPKVGEITFGKLLSRTESKLINLLSLRFGHGMIFVRG